MNDIKPIYEFHPKCGSAFWDDNPDKFVLLKCKYANYIVDKFNNAEADVSCSLVDDAIKFPKCCKDNNMLCYFAFDIKAENEDYKDADEIIKAVKNKDKTWAVKNLHCDRDKHSVRSRIAKYIVKDLIE
jgi:hypothetical protein